MSLSLAAILAESARRRPDHPAVVLDGEVTTYAELWLQARRYAAVLRETGIGPGDRVAILISNTPHFPASYYGLLALGAIVVPIHALLRAEEISYVLTDSGSKALICAVSLLGEGAKGADLAGVKVFSVAGRPERDPGAGSNSRIDDPDSVIGDLDAEAAITEPISGYVPREPGDMAVVLYTSGTTGQPKGAMLTQLNLLMNVDTAVISSFDYTADDRILGCLPLFHSFGQTSAMNTAFRLGATLVLMSRFDGRAALRLLIQERCTVFLGVPTMYFALLEAARLVQDRPRLRFCISGGASLPLSAMENFEEVFETTIYEGYGLTETSPVATVNQKDWPRKAGTVGQPVWGVDVEIARAEVEGRIELLGRGELGEIVMRGHNLMAGYLNRPEETAEAIVDGWFRTGDLGVRDEEGFVSIVDRKKDIVLRGGYSVYPREVEEVLSKHPDIEQVAVIGLAHPSLGEEVCAVVIPADGSSPEAGALVAWARERLAAYKYPRRIEFVETFPLGPSGKVLKRELVGRFS